MKYVTGYTGFSSTVSEQSGNYLALKVGVAQTGLTTTVELIGGTLGVPVTLDDDMNIIIRISDPATQTVCVVTALGRDSVTNVYGLTGLTCEAEPEPETDP